MIDDDYKGAKDLIYTTIAIAHESVHAIAGEGSNSIQEEVIAYQLGDEIARRLKVRVDFGQLKMDNAINANLKNENNLLKVQADWAGSKYESLPLFAPSDIFKRLQRYILPFMHMVDFNRV